MSFRHLHLHTQYSLQDAMIKAKDLAKKLKEMNMDSVAITNHGYLYNILEEYRTLTKEGIKPILGLETYVAPRRNTDRDYGIDNANYHLVLLAENNVGWRNIQNIASDAAVNGTYYKPRTDKEHLRKWHEGLICLSACLGGEVQKLLVDDKYDEAKIVALEHDDIFGRGNYFLELQDHGMPEQEKYNAGLIQISEETGIPLVVTNDCHYISSSDAVAHDVLMAMQAKVTVNDENRKIYPSNEFYVKSEEEMTKIFSGHQEAIDNTGMIADRCEVEIEFGKTRLPPFKIPDGYKDEEEYIRELVYDGAKRRYGELTDRETERIEYELSVVIKMGFVGYFLIVWDKMRFCREGTLNAWEEPRKDWEEILTGPGRGSGAGSILAYCLWITQVDPLKYDLLFNRFLDVHRVSMPDCKTRSNQLETSGVKSPELLETPLELIELQRDNEKCVSVNAKNQ